MSSAVKGAFVCLAIVAAIGSATAFSIQKQPSYFDVARGQHIRDVLKAHPKMTLKYTLKDIHVYNDGALSVAIGRDDQTVDIIRYECTKGDLAAVDGIPCGATAQGVLGKYRADHVTIYCKRDDGNPTSLDYYIPRPSDTLIFRVMDTGVAGFVVVRGGGTVNPDWAKDNACDK